jgi:hypothetical protein
VTGYNPQAIDAVLAEVNRRLGAGVRVLANGMKQTLSTPAPRVRLTNRFGVTYYVAGWVKGGPGLNKTRTAGSYRKDKKSGALVRRNVPYEPSPATPNAPPRKLSGRLRASITSELDKDTMTARAGTNVPYGKRHEMGGLHQWAMQSVALVRPELERILGSGASVSVGSET